MVDRPIPDASERYRALNPENSFIVQAPAGSGKTTLLIQRYLRLLTCVDSPEEIIAITFTRKAAAEMRTRVLAVLELHQGEEHNNSDIEQDRLNRELSTTVLDRDQQLGWQLVSNPQRLRIQTIDALCASLVRQMPVLSEFGAPPRIAEHAHDLYREAARITLDLIEKNGVIAQDIKKLLVHLDNDWARVESLVAEMLAKRDQWLRHLMTKKPREELEIALQNVRNNALQSAYRLFPLEFQNELLQLIRYAAGNLGQSGSEQPTSEISMASELENLSTASIQHWNGIAALLLTAKGEWRKKITVNEGFPSGNNPKEKISTKEWKTRLMDLLELLRPNEEFRRSLQAIRLLPSPNYSDQQWQVIAAITSLLHHAVAALEIVFQQSGQVDFAEVTQRALLALGDSESPTDLALALDHRIKHLLIDEFQDTSISQFQLIEKLTAGWEAGDGRTLFAVGDPMQSIYRFREAEVGLFLQARQQGIGNVTLQPITLTANFRSQQGIVDWVNDTFGRIMPDEEDISKGAVAYAASVAIHALDTAQAVKVYPFLARDDIEEAYQVLDILVEARRKNPNDTIAVLVRNRNHLTAITAELKKAKIAFRAIEIEPLRDRSVVQDLWVLTRALLNPADRIAWIALLRTPFCGIRLDDLLALIDSEQQHSQSNITSKAFTVWELLCNENHWRNLSTDAVERICRLKSVLQLCIEHRQRRSLRDTVEAAWRILGGPGCVNIYTGNNARSEIDLSDAMVFLDYLEKQESACSISDIANFEAGLSELYALPDPNADDRLQIMTIHKAKGLEFDTVIVPGLGRNPRNRDKQLLKWIEQPSHEKNTAQNVITNLLLASIEKTGEPVDYTYRWIDNLNQEKEQFESVRLLYVAATRARKCLHLLGHVNLDTTQQEPHVKEPGTRSLLSQLWVVVAPDYWGAATKAQIEANIHPPQEDSKTINQNFYRLPADWKLPDAFSAVAWQEPPSNEVFEHAIEFSWASEIARCVGIVAHRWLQQIAEDEMREWNAARIQSMQDQFKKNLFAVGLNTSEEKLNGAIDLITRALTNAVTDPIGQWILGPQQNAQNELKITGVVKNDFVKGVIDRTFYDSDKTRWIIDYKISSHEGADLQGFLNREQLRYQPQLDQYKQLMQQIDPRPVKLALYFPMMRSWRVC